MIPLNHFLQLVNTAVPRFAQYPPNLQQATCVLHNPSIPLMIVAGPGTGKTTVLVLRALRLVFVEGWMPEHIVLTTFTNKAADEIRARLIEWGLLLQDYLRINPPSPTPNGFALWLDSIDINRFVAGTLDSICEELLTTHRDPADPAPVLVEGFVGNGILARHAMFPAGAHSDQALAAYLTPFTWDGSAPANFRDTLNICRMLIDRFIHDLVDLGTYQSDPTHAQGRQTLVTALNAYRQFMMDRYCMDFSLLEDTFLSRLQAGRLQRFTTNVRAVLIDEYQDTNPLQERIYLTLIGQTNASFTIVGDDDQSLYRFRGATVELFRDFEQRFIQALPHHQPPQREHLLDNYRSTPAIVEFFNNYIENDPNFRSARVQNKPRVVDQLPSNGIPVLGMFRPNVQALANNLADFLIDIFQGCGHTLTVDGQQFTLTRAPNGGDFGDAVLLSHTVNEFARGFGNNPPRERLPRLLRNRLMQHGVEVYNPRGQGLRDIPVVQQLLGLVLECVDPHGHQQGNLRVRAEAQRYLNQWRQAAHAFIQTRPSPNQPHRLSDFVTAWQNRAPQTGTNWPSEWNILELCFKLITWIPMLHNDPEGQVWLEAITRCVAQAATFSPNRSMIRYGAGVHDDNSVRQAIRDILVPIAESAIEVDEEIMPHVPRSRFPIMTIHQAKGLEFPLVIVDVASDYATNSRFNRFRRYPEAASSVQNIEDDLANHCAIGHLRQMRSALDRSFDDLIRLYYVAYSRPESVLLLVGNDVCLRYSTTIRHIATWWRMDEGWPWRMPVPEPHPPPALANNIPLKLI